MLKIHLRHVLTVCLAMVAGTSFGQPNAVKFVASDAFLAGPKPESGLANCQPLRGDRAEIIGAAQKVIGTEVLPLRVLSGRCAGLTGWAGATQLEVAVERAEPPAVAIDSGRFNSSDSLFDSLEPKPVKASCQPLRGDAAQFLETARFSGTEVYRVKVLSGRCEGTIGWAGATRIER